MLEEKNIIKNIKELDLFSKKIINYLKPNTFLLLEGSLGVGKTTLTKLIAKNLGIKKEIISPTFLIFQNYKIKKEYFLNHFDFFRVNLNDNLNLFKELTDNNLNIIEWPEKNLDFWKEENCIRIIIKRIKNSKHRLILFNKTFI